MEGSDVYPVWLNQVIIGALPVAASRHNSPSRPHFIHKLVCSHLPGGDACIVVMIKTCIFFLSILKILIFVHSMSSFFVCEQGPIG